MSTAQQQYSKYVSVPSDEGIRVDKAITIEKPIDQVYQFWRRFSNLPRFMRHLESVSVQDDCHSHWVAKTLAGKTVEWDAEIIEQRENEMISWRSLPGADVDNAGSVWFTPVPGGQGTVVRVEMKYIPPAGKAGAWLAKLFGRDAESEIGDDLNRLKTFLETGRVPEKRTESGWVHRVGAVSQNAVETMDDCVRRNAWTALASVAVAGLALGFLLGWRMAQDA